MKRIAALIVMLFAGPAIGQNGGTSEAAPAGQEPSVDEYVVEPGDTLWDITASVVGDPFQWPRIWSYNPEITNPNWIYPGDIIRFYPSDVPLPQQAELVAGVREIPRESQEEIVEEEVAEIEVIETVPRRPRQVGRLGRFVGLFVTPQQLQEAGILSNAVDDKMLLSARDTVYLSFPRGRLPEKEERFMVYRTLGQVKHPRTGDLWGYMTQVTALADVEGITDGTAVALLENAVAEVERGQYVAPLISELLEPVQPKLASAQVEGVVLAVHYDGGVVAGEGQIIFVDKGARDGLSRGDRLRVRGIGDPLTGRRKELPFYNIGELVVMQTTDVASTCLVVESLREIEAGDPFVSVVSLENG